jgi:hypothetical protein
MKVLDLKCAHQHVFEGWFASEDDFQSQLTRDLVQCPMCGDAAISKQLSAPRLNLGATPRLSPAVASAPAAPDAGVSGGANPSSREIVPAGAAPALSVQDLQDLQAVQADWLKMARHVMANTEDVGSHFAEVARQMHYGETEERSIRGQTSRQEAVELLEEGITVMPLPLPDALKGPLQ